MLNVASILTSPPPSGLCRTKAIHQHRKNKKGRPLGSGLQMSVFSFEIYPALRRLLVPFHLIKLQVLIDGLSFGSNLLLIDRQILSRSWKFTHG